MPIANAAHPPDSPGSAGTTDKAVERIEEGTASTASGNGQVRATFDPARAAGFRRVRATGNIDTSGTARFSQPYNLSNGDVADGL